ncbi:hypothetical protein D5281_17440 [bacterium 1xD42-62]|uniref:Uncharacterized protein n=1 Tax=Parablautia muri TaxID=2320879 RepID=A0A9X5BIJ4_9FIRM|nr:hypothetical protein [Parablautia muri]
MPVISFLLDYIAVMGLFIFLGYYFYEGVKRMADAIRFFLYSSPFLDRQSVWFFPPPYALFALCLLPKGSIRLLMMNFEK